MPLRTTASGARIRFSRARCATDGFAVEVDIGPSEVPDSPDSVPGLVRQHECDVEPPADLSGHLQKRPVFLVRNDDANRVLLDGLPETLERVSVEEQAAVLVSRPRGPS